MKNRADKRIGRRAGPVTFAAVLIAGFLAACDQTDYVAPPPISYDSGQASCSEKANDPRFDRILLPQAIDPALIDRAVRLMTNEKRCMAGRSPLALDPRLAEAARIHATDMADVGFVAPTRPADPEKTLAKRYELANVGPYKRRGENLMRISLEVPGVAEVAEPGEACDFARRLGLVPTYRTVARRLVDAWSRTEAYSASMLAPDWTHMGSAIGIRPIEGSCGDVYAAQSFKAL